jgi:hypothetical protein
VERPLPLRTTGGGRVAGVAGQGVGGRGRQGLNRGRGKGLGMGGVLRSCPAVHDRQLPWMVAPREMGARRGATRAGFPFSKG